VSGDASSVECRRGFHHGLLGTLLLVLCCRAAVEAHPAPFSFLDLRLDAGVVSGALTVHDLDAAYELGLTDADALQNPDVARRHGPALAEVLMRRLRLRLDGEPVAVTLSDVVPVPDRQGLRFALTVASSRAPGRIQVDTILFPYDGNHQTFVNVYEDGALRYQDILDARRAATEYYAGAWQGVGAVLATFIPAGAEHILIGPDHLLFLLGLLLLGGAARRLALIVTAFTLGHSVTLSMAALDVYAPPASIVEPLIALSIVLVGVDNLLVGAAPSTGRDLRPWMAALFGLVHGFGFASVLKEFGLPRQALGWSLFGFNVGVELGQLAVVVPCALALAALDRVSAMARARVAMVGSVVVVAAGVYWFVQRVFFPGGL
jgi:hydrogenase/urease accessory protein HupE